MAGDQGRRLKFRSLARSLGRISALTGWAVLIGAGLYYFLSRYPAKVEQEIARKPAAVVAVAMPAPPPASPRQAAELAEARVAAAKIETAVNIPPAAPRPEPDEDKLVILVVLENPSQIFVRVYAQDGKSVYEKSAGMLAPGNYRFSWDGRDMKGNPAPPGAYRVAVESDHGAMEKFIKIRQEIMEVPGP